MEENVDTINIEYKVVRKTSALGKAAAPLLTIIFVFVPMYEFLTEIKTDIIVCTYGIVGCGCTIL